MSDTKKVTIILPKQYNEKLDAVKEQKGLAKAEQVRRALDFYWERSIPPISTTQNDKEL